MRPIITDLAVLTVLATLATACADVQTPGALSSDAVIASDAAPSIERFTSGADAFDTHSFWLDTGREVVVFDAQFTADYAKKLVAAIRLQTRSPIRWVVITHPNPDKFNGASVFQALGAKVVASESTAKAIPDVHAYKKHFFVNVARSFTEQTYPPEATIDVVFRGDYDLPLEGKTRVRLHELAHRGVSSTQTVAFVPNLQALIVGDLVHHEAHAWLEGGIVAGKPTPDLASWKLALDELRAYPGATVFGGRGTASKVDDAIESQKGYLDRMNALVTRYVAGLGDAKSELYGPKAGEHYAKLTALAEAELPSYALGYMIQYGVYGLAQQIASAKK
jgi:glyoxylase-like metal-dependent hydrolase (beta-lactamase superfamily II)